MGTPVSGPATPGDTPLSSSPTWVSKVTQSDHISTYHPEVETNKGRATISIPEEVISESTPLWTDFILGHFIGTAPHVGKVHAIVNKIWNNTENKSKIDVQFLNETAALFKVSDAENRRRIINRRFWNIAEIPMVVCEWCPENAHKRLDLTSIPLWVDLKGVPGYLYSRKGLSYIASVVGKPIRIHPNTLKCLRLDVARVLVEVDLTKNLMTELYIKGRKGEDTPISILYPWLPPRCSTCGNWGHLETACNMGEKTTDANATSIPTGETPPTINIATATSTGALEGNTQHISSPSKKQTQKSLALTEAHYSVFVHGSTSASNEQDAPSLTAKHSTTDIETEKSGNDWIEVKRHSRSGSPTLEAISKTVTSKGEKSPLNFNVLVDTVEEGEIEDDEVIVALEEDSVEAGVVGEKVTQQPRKPSQQVKEKQGKQQRRVIMGKKEMILASHSNHNKKASSRKL